MIVDTHRLRSTEILPISPKSLLAFYWLIPISCIIVVFDIFVFNGQIKQSLPKSPEYFFFFSIFFNAPHIFASTFSFFDVEYIKFYRIKIFISLGLLVMVNTILPQIIGFKAYYIIFIIWTGMHISAQQFGLCSMLTKLKNNEYIIWKWLGIMIAILIYLDLIVSLRNIFPNPNFFSNLISVLLLSYTIITFIYSKQTISKIGTIAVWANYGLVLSSWILCDLKYYFFAILAPRIIHDMTALSFYMIHDQNRNACKQNNFVYRYLKLLNLPIIFLCPILAITCSYVYNLYANMEIILLVFMTVSMFHYYIESFMWKNDSIHRQALVIHNT